MSTCRGSVYLTGKHVYLTSERESSWWPALTQCVLVLFLFARELKAQFELTAVPPPPPHTHQGHCLFSLVTHCWTLHVFIIELYFIFTAYTTFCMSPVMSCHTLHICLSWHIHLLVHVTLFSYKYMTVLWHVNVVAQCLV